MIFYSTIEVISLSLYALICELYIYDKLFHKLTINKKKKLKRIKRSWKHRGLCLLSLWTQTVFLMKFFVWSQGKFYLITPLACPGTNPLWIQAMGCDLDPHVLSHVFFMLHWLWVALWMVARVMEWWVLGWFCFACHL